MSSSGVCKCVTVCALAGFGVFCLTLIILNQWYGNPLKHQILSILAPGCLREVPWNIKHEEEIDAELSEKVKLVTSLQRKIIRDDMEGYQYPNGKFNRSASKLEDLLIEENGNPIRNIILSTWRSGSNFLGDIINAHPATFYHEEPLTDFAIVQIRGPPLAADALKRVRTLFDCEFADQGGYLKFSKARPWNFRRNTRLWKQCETDEELCFNHESRYSRRVLDRKVLAVRMVLLVRDPRGTIGSRKHPVWCPPSRDCSDPALLCADLASDYEIAMELLKTYPTSFKVIRYEDLAAEPYEHAKEIAEFYGLDFHKNMEVFLDTHTKWNSGDNFSTFRDTKKTPYHWRNDLAFEEVEKIQRSCVVAMERWGYVPALNASHLTEFNPVTNYDLTYY